VAAGDTTMPLKTPRLSRCRVGLAKKPSTALSQEAEVGDRTRACRERAGTPAVRTDSIQEGRTWSHRQNLAGRSGGASPASPSWHCGFRATRLAQRNGLPPCGRPLERVSRELKSTRLPAIPGASELARTPF